MLGGYVPARRFTHQRTVYTGSQQCMGDMGIGEYSTNVASAAWTSANRAYYLPVTLSEPTTVYQFFSFNGATASGNLDIGLFNLAGTKLLSTGATAQSGTNAIQLADVANTTFGRGYYWLGMSMDNTTGTVLRISTIFAEATAILGAKIEASAYTLPATATLTTDNSTIVLPIFGFIGEAVG